jgi:hypothetical protein
MAVAKKDDNGWLEIVDNKLSRPGIFEYLGQEIHPSLEPDRVYRVLRPIEELADPECAESFRLRPWILGHTMLGDKYGVDASEAGIHGIVGEKVYFDEQDMWLKGNIKVFTRALEEEIESGNDELSLGYGCQYDFTPGILDGNTYQYIPGTPRGAEYDIVQRKIRGNHLASVEQSRMDVAVFDGALGMDKLTVKLPHNEGREPMDAKPKAPEAGTAKDQEMGLTDIAKALADLTPILQSLGKVVSAMSPGSEPAEPTETPMDMDPPAENPDPAEDEGEKDKTKEEESGAMDRATVQKMISTAVEKATKPLLDTIDTLKTENAGMDQRIMKEVAERDELAEKLSFYIPAFDHKSMSLKAVAKHGVEQLGLTCEDGQERVALKAYLHNRPSTPKLYAHTALAEDGKTKAASPIDEYYNS